MKFLLGFVVGLVFASIFGGCAKPGAPVNQIGRCSLPPAQDGFMLVACVAEFQDQSNVNCVFVSDANETYWIRRAVYTTGCGEWKVLDDDIVLR
jgi:hypothetical protein